MLPMALFALISAGVLMALFEGPSDDEVAEEEAEVDPIDQSAPIVDDPYLGTSGDDSIEGGTGDELIDAGDGDDFIDGGEGDDTIYGGAGDDLIVDNFGANVLDGGSGSDTIFAEDFPGAPFAPDVLSGGEGDDFLWGDDGDTMTGGDGTDIFSAWFDEDDDAPVTVTDFDWLTETLYLDFDRDTFGAVTQADLTHDVEDDAFLVRLFVSGKEVAILTNTTTFDASRVRVESFA